MKKFCFITVLSLCVFSLPAQELVTTPVFPQDSGTVSVVDCSMETRDRNGYANTNDVYVHIGLITSSSTSSSDWRYVPFTWGTTNPAAHAVWLGGNKYSYTINNVRSFFGVPAGESILKLAILFRNGSGSLVQRNSDGSDMYQDIYLYSLSAKFTQPPFQPMYKPIPVPITKNIGDVLSLTYQTNHLATMKLYFNGTQVGSVVNGDSLNITVPISAAGNQVVVGVANVSTDFVSDTFSVLCGHSL